MTGFLTLVGVLAVLFFGIAGLTGGFLGGVFGLFLGGSIGGIYFALAQILENQQIIYAELQRKQDAVEGKKEVLRCLLCGSVYGCKESSCPQCGK